MAASTNGNVNFTANNINAYIYTSGQVRAFVPNNPASSNEDNIPVTREAPRRRAHTKIDDNTFVAIYTRYSNHANGTYKIAEIMHRAPHSVHARALRLRDLGVNLPEAYYNRARSRVNVEELNRIIREVLSRRSGRSRRNFA